MEKIVNDYKTMSKYESRNLMAIFTGVSIPNKGFRYIKIYRYMENSWF
jgi:hypothetical protein